MKMNEDTIEASERTGCWDLRQISCLHLSLLDDNNICIKRKTDATEKKKERNLNQSRSREDPSIHKEKVRCYTDSQNP